MPKKNEDKDENLGEKLSVFGILGKLIEALIAHADGEIKKIKSKILHFSFIILFLMLSVVFILIGIAKVLPDLFPISEGLSFIIVGCVLIVVLAFYSVIKQI